jgi:hypothetical protein
MFDGVRVPLVVALPFAMVQGEVKSGIRKETLENLDNKGVIFCKYICLKMAILLMPLRHWIRRCQTRNRGRCCLSCPLR